MGIDVGWDAEVSTRFPELALCIGVISGVQVRKENADLHRLKRTICEEAKARYGIEALKDDPTVRAYRDFFWELGIDPTKIRPSGEALLRRVLNGNELPSVSTVVDAYNLASMRTVISVSGFDRELLNPPFRVRFAENETFTGIGMSSPMVLIKNMLVLADERRVLCIYPYRDSDSTKITLQTRDAVIIGYGAPGIRADQLKEAVRMTLDYVKRFSSGRIEVVEVFESSQTC